MLYPNSPRSAFDDRRLVTIAEAASAWSVDPSALARRAEEAGLVPRDDGRFRVGELIEAALDAAVVPSVAARIS